MNSKVEEKQCKTKLRFLTLFLQKMVKKEKTRFFK